MRTFSFSIFAILTLAFSLYSCSSEKKAEAKINYTDTITIAVTPTFDCLPIIVAKETGIADSRKHFFILQYHTSKADCDTALAGGSASAIFTDYGRAELLSNNWTKLIKQKKGKKARIDSLSIFPHNNLHYYLFTNFKARLNEAKQLKDKMIAVDRNSAEVDFAQQMLDSAKLSTEKTFLVNIQNYTVRQNMIINNIMDAVVYSEPYATMARKAGHKSIYSSDHQKAKSYGRMVCTKDVAIIKHIYNLGCHAINSVGIHGYDSILVRNLKVPEATVKAIPNQKFVPIK